MARGARRAAGAALVLIAVAAAAGWALTAPSPLPDDVAAGWSADAEAVARGERLFNAGGCASCHAAPEAEGEAKRVLSGGRRFETAFGVFRAPNISPHPEAGIGDWSPAQFASALLRGVSPDGAHYYPAFPWTSYARLEPRDAFDLLAYIRTLPEDTTQSRPHELGFPWNIRRGLGLWKRLHLSPDWVVTEGLDAKAERGRRLVEGVGHCGECHTPRGPLGGLELDRWLAGGPNPDGEGTIPNITPSGDGIGSWSESDIAYYLETGFTPDYDSVGGSMVAVIDGISKLPAEDREAIAAYLKAVPAQE
ncbi:MAG: c-type cytochrome [Pseudomonadota bacterium]